MGPDNHSIYKILRHRIWRFLIVMSTIGGAVQFLAFLLSRDPYSLTLALTKSTRLVSANHDVLHLKSFGGERKPSFLYVSDLNLANTGRKALTRRSEFKPLTVDIGSSNKILRLVSSRPSGVHYKGHTIYYDWHLLNPGETITATVYSRGPLDVHLAYRIKDVEHVRFVSYLKRPPVESRILRLGYLWAILLALSILITQDSVRLLVADIELGKVFRLARSLLSCSSVNKEEYLNSLFNVYTDYARVAPFLFVSPRRLIRLVSEAGPDQPEITEKRDLLRLDRATIRYVRYANWYDIRGKVNLLVGPILFGMCAVRLVIAIIL